MERVVAPVTEVPARTAGRAGARKRIREDVENGAQKQPPAPTHFCASRWTPSARARRERGVGHRGLPQDRQAACPKTSSTGRARAVARFERLGDQSAESSVIRTISTGCWPCPGRSGPRTSSIRRRARCSTPTTRASRTSRRASPSTGGAQAAQGSPARRRQALGRHPDARRPSRHGQDVDRRVDRQGATGRKFVRMSLGGVRDGRRSAATGAPVGALPGRLVRALRDAGTMNP